VIVAALAERARTRPEPFADLADERLMAGLFHLWLSAIADHAGLASLPQCIEAELKRRGVWGAALGLYIRPQLKHRALHIRPLYSLMRSDEDSTLAADLAADWLRRYPKLIATSEYELIDRLLHSPRRAELCDIGDRLRGEITDIDRRHNWDAVQVLVDFEAAVARLGARVDPALLWNIRSHAGDKRLSQRPSIAMAPRQFAWIVTTFRRLWPAEGRPTTATWGDDNSWDASEYLRGLVARLGEDTSDEAVSAIEALRDSAHDGYTDYIRWVATEQRRKRVERDYSPPFIHQIHSVLSAGSPTDAADLQAVVLGALETAQSLLRGSDVDWYRGFFRENGRHMSEEPCRDEIIKMLRNIDNSLEYIPEAHVAEDKRVDIVVRARERLILPIEVKGQWHAELWTAADKQLDHLYVNDWRAERGVYLVLWFGGGTTLTQPPNGSPKPATAADLQSALFSTSKAAVAGRVDIVVLDVTRPPPV